MAFTFRRVEPGDKKRLVEMTSKIWEGGDFIEKVFDEWVKDRVGEFTAVLHYGKLIGCGKLTFLTKTDAWLQGLRKDPEYDVKGVGNAVTNYYLDLLRDRRPLTSIRFATYIHNYKSIKVNQDLGFKIALRLSMKHIDITDKDSKFNIENSPVQQITEEELVLPFIQRSLYFKNANNMVNLDWEVYPYSDDLIREKFIKPGHCYGIIDGDHLRALAMTYYFRKMSISFIDGYGQDDAMHLTSYLKAVGANEGWLDIRAYLPNYPKVLKWLGEFGFKSRECENDFLLFEYPLENFKE